MEPLSTAPPVVAVVVTCDPGPWLEETLASFAAQDYPNLSVLVVDSASVVDPTGRVAAVLPRAFVRRLTDRVGFGRAANEVLGVVEGASHYVFCHDDVAPAPDAVRAMVEEAFRSNAGVVTPKLVEWDRPDHLVAVGMGADRIGVLTPLIERGELDQEQHDGVRDVFVAPSSATLIRADLFAILGGYAPEVDQFGEDLDLSWRAQVAGARVVCAPAARVRHLEAQQQGMRSGWSSPLARRRAQATVDEHRLRTLVVCAGRLGLIRLLVVALLSSLVEALGQLVTGRPGEAALTMRSLGRAYRHPRALLRRRRATQKVRHASDRSVRRRQTRGSAKLRSFLRSRIREGPGAAVPLAPDNEPGQARISRQTRRAAAGRALAAGADDEARAAIGTGEVAVGGGSWRLPLTVGFLLLAVLVIGSRELLGHDLPAVGQIPVTTGGFGAWWRAWWTTWQPGLLGAQGASPPGLALLGVAGTVFFGAVGVLQRVLVLAPLVVGPFGAYRAARWWGSLRGRVAALLVYAAVPVPYNALAHGDWPALAAYAAAPWVLSLVARLSDDWPFPPTLSRRAGGRVVGVGLLVALVAAFVPSWLLVVPMVGVGLALGSLLAGQVATAVRTMAVAVGAGVVAAILLLPWSAGVLHSRVAAFGVPAASSQRLGLGQILRFHTGPVGSQPLGWALLAAAALPLVIGRSWRLAWAARMWMVALVCFALAWAGSRGWIPSPAPEDLLVFAAAALAGATALGAVAFELDLPGYRFGWRQLASGVAAVAVVVAAVPTLAAAGNGRWDLPSAGASSVLGFLPSPQSGDYRVLWIGQPDALPLASQYLQDGVGYATSFDGEPTQADLWAPSRTDGSAVLATELRRSEDGLTTQLGHLLAPFGVRYLVVPDRDGPSGSGSEAALVPAAVLDGLSAQTDLQAVDIDPDETVYINAAWAPARAVVDPSVAAVAAAPAAAQPRLLGLADLAGGTRPVLTGSRPDYARGPVAAGATVTVAASRTSSWSLRVDGRTVGPQPAYGWSMRFTVPAGATGTATLSAGTSTGARVGQIVDVVLWGLAVAVLILDRRRRLSRPPELVRPEWFVPLVLPRRASTRSGSRSGLTGGDSDLGSDELWIDA
jgi:GT2 family glycosyltransferase